MPRQCAHAGAVEGVDFDRRLQPIHRFNDLNLCGGSNRSYISIMPSSGCNPVLQSRGEIIEGRKDQRSIFARLPNMTPGTKSVQIVLTSKDQKRKSGRYSYHTDSVAIVNS